MDGEVQFSLPLDSPVMPFHEVSVLEAYMRKVKREMECLVPAKVVKYDREKHLADVQPLIDPGNGMGKYVPPVVLKNVQVWRLQCGGFLIDAPIHPGETGWLLGADRDTYDAIEANSGYTGESEDGENPNTENKGPMPAKTLMRHQYAFGTFIPARWGEVSLGRGNDDALVIEQIEKDGKSKCGIRLHRDGSVEVDAEAGLNVTGRVNVKGDAVVTGDLSAEGEFWAGGSAKIDGAADVGGELTVGNGAEVWGDIKSHGSIFFAKDGKSIALDPVKDLNGGQFGHAKFREVSVVVGRSSVGKFTDSPVRLALRRMMVLSTDTKMEPDIVIPTGGGETVSPDDVSTEFRSKTDASGNEDPLAGRLQVKGFRDGTPKLVPTLAKYLEGDETMTADMHLVVRMVEAGELTLRYLPIGLLTGGGGGGGAVCFTPKWDDSGNLIGTETDGAWQIGRQVTTGQHWTGTATGSGYLIVKFTHAATGTSITAEAEVDSSVPASTDDYTYVPVYYFSNGQIVTYFGMPVLPCYDVPTSSSSSNS